MWWRTGSPASQRVLPDGSLDLICFNGKLIVAGPDTVAHLTSDAAGANYWGVRFAPGQGPGIIGVPAHELRDQRVDLADMWPAATVRRWEERAAADPVAALEQMAAERAAERDVEADPSIAGVVAELQSGATVAAVAAATSWSERQLLRRSLDAFGYGPKTLARILRLNRALAMARDGIPFATVAARAGYTDQAHLSHEVKALSGVPLKSLIG